MNKQNTFREIFGNGPDVLMMTERWHNCHPQNTSNIWLKATLANPVEAQSSLEK